MYAELELFTTFRTGHDYDVRRVTYEATKRSFMMRCLYEQKTVCSSSVV